MRTQPIWIASLETRNFDFEAYGDSEARAKDALLQGLRVHAKQVEIAEDWFQEDLDSISTREVHIGAVYRDGSAL